MDSILFIKDAALRQKALSWCRNVFGMRMVCSKCNLAFYRGHINRGALLSPTTVSSPLSSDSHYSILDELLNQSRYQDFHAACQTLMSQLHRQ
jgi:hypothetical protein